MKKIIFSAALILSSLLFKTADAQVNVSLGVNIGSQPDWGPVGYDRADYYYMPDIDAYYDVPARQYVYYDNSTWIHSVNLPPRYSNYNVYNGYKVVINRPNPWMRNDYYKTRYVKYKGRKQVIIRDNRGPRGPKPGRGPGGPGWGPQHGPDHGPGKGHGNGHGNGHGKH